MTRHRHARAVALVTPPAARLGAVAIALLAGCDGGLIYNGAPDLAASVDLAVPDLSLPDLTPPLDFALPPDFTPPPDLATRPNPLTLWLSFHNGDENALVLVDDPNPPAF